MAKRRITIIIEDNDYSDYVYPKTIPGWREPVYPKIIDLPCMHLNCSQCNGAGIKANGGICIHMMSCPCPRCTPTYSWSEKSYVGRI